MQSLKSNKYKIRLNDIFYNKILSIVCLTFFVLKIIIIEILCVHCKTRPPHQILEFRLYTSSKIQPHNEFPKYNPKFSNNHAINKNQLIKKKRSKFTNLYTKKPSTSTKKISTKNQHHKKKSNTKPTRIPHKSKTHPYPFHPSPIQTATLQKPPHRLRAGLKNARARQRRVWALRVLRHPPVARRRCHKTPASDRPSAIAHTHTTLYIYIYSNIYIYSRIHDVPSPRRVSPPPRAALPRANFAPTKKLVYAETATGKKVRLGRRLGTFHSPQLGRFSVRFM